MASKDTVKLTTFHRSKYICSISPFGIKLETWMRLAKIPYETEYAWSPRANKQTHQIPFVTVNGEQINDSNNIIRYLSKHFKVNTDEYLTKEQKVISHTFQRTLDEHTCWSMFYYRYAEHPELFVGRHDLFPIHWLMTYIPGIKYLLNYKMSSGYDHGAKAQGIGRKPTSEIYRLGMEDLKALSEYLGDKKYMFGDKPSKIDCTMFGVLSQLVYVPIPSYPHKIMIENECRNLIEHADRMKALLWPDWNSLCETNTFETMENTE
ncbi:unnamed protein product [Owenia fusiformis]|uniref:Uncharacterized protein n=1 Tax=Owenia fusiformis TaxID=6347 RepID=A0A8J1TVN6_OWEFU|nr:unnamed protein product [Owenia fusiformis]